MDDDVAFELSPSHDTKDEAKVIEIVSSILSQLSTIEPMTRERVMQTLIAFYGAPGGHSPKSGGDAKPGNRPESLFSEERSISPKQFMIEKQPITDVEKVACLAYYLTHYRNTPHFKTLDISKLNTEAAQIKFANATVSLENAVKRNYLVPATKGNKQLSALGEQFVQALPDRARAKSIIASSWPRRRQRRQDERADE